MSTFIIFRQVALSLPTELAMAAIRATVDGAELNYQWNASEERLLVFQEGGDNNVISYESSAKGRIARSWMVSAAGSMHDVIREAIQQSVGVHGGMVELGGRGRNTKPENYIKTVRTTAEEAVTWDVLSERLKGSSFALRIGDIRSSDQLPKWHEPYREHLKSEGRLVPDPDRDSLILNAAPAGTDEGLADLFWATFCLSDDDRCRLQVPYRDFGMQRRIDRLYECTPRQRKQALY